MACVVAFVAGLLGVALAHTDDMSASPQQKYGNYKSDMQKYEKMGAHYMPKIHNMSDPHQWEDAYMHEYMDNKYMPHIKNFSNGTQVGDAFRKEYAGKWSKYEEQSHQNVTSKQMAKKMTEKYAGPFEKFIKQGEAEEKAEKKAKAAAEEAKEQKAVATDTSSPLQKSLAAKRTVAAEKAPTAEQPVSVGAEASSMWPFTMLNAQQPSLVAPSAQKQFLSNHSDLEKRSERTQHKYSDYKSYMHKYEKMGEHYMPKIHNISDPHQWEDAFMHKYNHNKYMPHIKNFSNGMQVGHAFMKEYAGQWSKYEGQSQQNLTGKEMEKKMTEKYAGPFEKFIKEGEAEEKAEKKSEAAAAETSNPVTEKTAAEGNPSTVTPPAAGSSWPFEMTETKVTAPVSQDVNAAFRAVGTTVTCAAICGVVFAGMYAHRRSSASALSQSLLAAEDGESVLSQYDQLA